MAGMTHGAWCHIEIPAKSVEAAKTFYGGLFGWSFTDMPEMGYSIYKAGQDEVGGGIWDPPAGVPRQILAYLNVENLDASSAKVESLGGRLLGERKEVPGHGWFRIIADPEGNLVALWETSPEAKAKYLASLKPKKGARKARPARKPAKKPARKPRRR